MTKKQWTIIFMILFSGSVFAALKMIFFDYTLDEEYQMMMGYRLLRGDHLFREMWEPHQTSAFLCAGLMWIYRSVAGTYTGVLLFLRLCTTLIQVALSLYLYRILCRLLDRNYALLCTLIYFNIIPKNIQIPDFSNMQLWFFTLTVLLLMQCYLPEEPGQKKRGLLIFASGICMALEVLSYPSCILLFPFFLLCIYRASRTKWRDMGLFAGACGLSAIVWFSVVLRHVELGELLRNVGYLLNFDLTHEISGATEGKLQRILSNLLGAGRFLLLACVMDLPFLALVRYKNRSLEKRQCFLIFLVIFVFVAEGMQIWLWVVKKWGYEVFQLHLFALLLAGFLAYRSAGNDRKRFAMGILGTLLSYISVIYISDLDMYFALPHGVLGVLFCAIVLVLALKNSLQAYLSDKISCFLLVSLCLVSILGKGYTLRVGRGYDVILDTGNIMRDGPAAGILSDYMNCYIYNCNCEDFADYINEDDVVLIVANMIMSAGTTPYMMAGAEVAHYSIVDPTTYDERLLAYWDLYPEKRPNVIVADCWYGQLMEDPDSWIVQYIENDFGYSQVDDGRYVRFYRK